jgi:hypothetical protein
MDLDIFKTIRETTDWLIEKYKNVTDSKTKNQLSQIANQISKLATNKAVYLASLKRGLNSNKTDVDLFEIQNAIRTAEKDTNVLNELLHKTDLDSAKVTFSLKNGLETLTMLKAIKLTELKELIAKDVVKIEDQKKIISELEAFEQKWVELGKEIDKAFK